MSLEIFKNLFVAKPETTETEAVETVETEAVFPNPLPEADEYNRRTFESWLTYRVFKSFPSDETKALWNDARTRQDSAKRAFKAVAPDRASLREYREEHETTEGIEITNDHLDALGISDRYDGPMVLPSEFSLPQTVANRLSHKEKAAKMGGRTPNQDLELTSLEGCGVKTAEALREAGYNSISQVEQTPASKLAEVPGVGPKTAAKWSKVEDVAVEESTPEPEPESEPEDEPRCGAPKLNGEPCGWKIEKSPCPHHGEEAEKKSEPEPEPEPETESKPDAEKMAVVSKMLDAGFTKEEIMAVLG